MFDAAELAQQITLLLIPTLPYLMKGGIIAGKAALEKIGEKVAEKSWDKADDMWNILRKHKSINQAAEVIIKNPNDPDAIAAFRLQLKLALNDNDELLNVVGQKMNEINKIRNVNAFGDRSVSIGGDVNGTIIDTSGDK